MKRQLWRILIGPTACSLYLLALGNAVNSTSFDRLGSSEALAQEACPLTGKITLDASKSATSSGGTVWSNTPLISGLTAVKSQLIVNETVGLRTISGLTTVVSDPGTNGVLSETYAEFTTSSAAATNLTSPSYSGGHNPLTYFDDPSGQLFDFGRYKAAATATSNTLTWSQFETKVVNNEQMHGIVHVTLDATAFVELPHLKTGSVNVKGTLVIDLINTIPGPFFKVFIEVPININPVISPTTGTTTLSPTDFDTWTTAAAARTSTLDPSPWPSGYASGWSEVVSYSGGVKDPKGKAITGYEPFGQTEDMPAMMYSGGIVDVHHDANISGVVYTPDFIEIEQKEKNNEVQYVNGAVIAGAGIYLESNTCGGGIAVVYDPDTLDDLKVTPIPAKIDKASLKIK